jgi:thiamine pyrophosphate-dependent acetolactate synthase large subunit-like protein
MQFAKSAPKGPVYLVGAREVMAEVIEPYEIDIKQWIPIGAMALPQHAVATVAEALVHAKSPLIVTGYSGRNHACPKQLVRLADLIPGLCVLDTGGSNMCFPFSHRASIGLSIGSSISLTKFDTILVLDCDVSWIPSGSPPSEFAKVYNIGVDPLSKNINFSFYPALGRW